MGRRKPEQDHRGLRSESSSGSLEQCHDQTTKPSRQHKSTCKSATRWVLSMCCFSDLYLYDFVLNACHGFEFLVVPSAITTSPVSFGSILSLFCLGEGHPMHVGVPLGLYLFVLYGLITGFGPSPTLWSDPVHFGPEMTANIKWGEHIWSSNWFRFIEV